MATTSIGAQMYTLREHLKTPADIAKTCKRVKDMGYDAIQVSAFGPIETDELAKILKDTGLVCAATHVSLDMMKDTSRCVDYHKALGCELTAIGGFNAEDISGEKWTQFAREYTQVSDELAKHGLRAGYHNHSHELAHFDGKPAMDILLENTGESVWFEVDTYWITHGGGDPAAWLTKIGKAGGNRLPAIHVKDMIISAQREQKMCEVGAGNLNWPAIMDAAKQAGVKWYLVERDRGDLDPFESLKISLENLKAMGLS